MVPPKQKPWSLKQRAKNNQGTSQTHIYKIKHRIEPMSSSSANTICFPPNGISSSSFWLPQSKILLFFYEQWNNKDSDHMVFLWFRSLYFFIQKQKEKLNTYSPKIKVNPWATNFSFQFLLFYKRNPKDSPTNTKISGYIQRAMNPSSNFTICQNSPLM